MDWSEFGPALDAASAEEKCITIGKIAYYNATDYSYTQVGDVYLKISNYVRLNPWVDDYRMYEQINTISEYDSFTTRIWDEESQTDVLTTHGYQYEKTGEETGILTLKDGALDIELKFWRYWAKWSWL